MEAVADTEQLPGIICFSPCTFFLSRLAPSPGECSGQTCNESPSKGRLFVDDGEEEEYGGGDNSEGSADSGEMRGFT